MSLTPEDKQLLHEAIDAAEGKGVCKYVEAGKPMCAVAQVAVRCGVTPEEMLRWTNVWSAVRNAMEAGIIPKNDKLLSLDVKTPAGKYILSYLQFEWDNDYLDVAFTRKSMHEMVDRL